MSTTPAPKRVQCTSRDAWIKVDDDHECSAPMTPYEEAIDGMLSAAGAALGIAMDARQWDLAERAAEIPLSLNDEPQEPEDARASPCPPPGGMT